ncbi:hypothetical protein ACOME3_003280 [Neoechinorhynchus agilis]
MYKAILMKELKSRLRAIENGHVQLLDPSPLLFWFSKLFSLIKKEDNSNETIAAKKRRNKGLCDCCTRSEQMKSLHQFVSGFRAKDVIAAYKDNDQFSDAFSQVLIDSLGEDMPIVFMELIECLGRGIPFAMDITE